MALTVEHDQTLIDFAEQLGTQDPVAVEGRRTRWEVGGELTTGTTTVSAPTGVVAYIPEEMIITVRAGTLVSDLNQVLRASNQRTAVPDRGGTVGGALAVGEDDLDVLGKGRIRSALLQVRYVSADGKIVTGGGPTVKNVSGFDLPRLMVGSLGTLGSLAEVILRTNPIPAEHVWLHSADADPFEARDAVLSPSAVLWNGSDTWVRLEGHAVDVKAEANALETAGHFSETDGPPTLPEHRWSLAPADLRDLDFATTGSFVASVGVGTLFAARPQPKRTCSTAVQTVANRMKLEFDPTTRLNPGRNPQSR